MFPREIQALDELFSREPEGWAEWAGSARSYHAAKREPCPGCTGSKSSPKPPSRPSSPEPPKRPYSPFDNPPPTPPPKEFRVGGAVTSKVPSSDFQKLDPSRPHRKDEWHAVFEPDPKNPVRPAGPALCRSWGCSDRYHLPNKV